MCTNTTKTVATSINQHHNIMKFATSAFSTIAFLAFAPASASAATAELDCSGGCIDRSKFRIRSIVHGTKDDPFWQRVQASAVQAGKDMGIDFQVRASYKCA